MTEALTPRQQREREFYNRYADGYCDRRVILDPILGHELRPWNSYWHFFQLVKDRFRQGARLLDFGCGWGSNTVLFAKLGYEVDAFDISEGNLEVARNLAAEHGVAGRARLHLMPAERLDFPDESFDVVAGIDILHHVQVEPALRECRRVLRPGGAAFFHEPVSNFLFDTVRNTWLVRRLVPNRASLDRHITHDERKLDRADVRAIRRVFPSCRFDRFRVLSRLVVLFPRRETLLQKLDLRLAKLPGYRALSGTVVMTLEKDLVS
jgi:2-polyprenyl-3-methyl-5-hydroxy-6-metoxy-1,4-benzoquinol methylase